MPAEQAAPTALAPSDPVAASVQECAAIDQGSDEMAFIKNLLEGDQQDFGKLLQELMQSQYQESIKKEIEKRSQMLQALPELLREHVTDLGKAYQEFAQALKLEKCLATLCQQLRPAVEGMTFENTAFKDELLASLDELYRALNDGSFARMTQPSKLPGNPLDLQNMFMQVLHQTAQAQQESSNFNEKSLEAMIERFTTLQVILIHDEQFRNQQNVRDITDTVVRLLTLASKKDHQKLASLCIDLVRPAYLDLSQKIKDLIGRLADAHIQCNQETEPLKKEALVYWLKQVKVYKQTVNAFFALVSSSSFDVSIFLRLISNTYEIVSVIFEAHRFESIFSIYNRADLSLRSAIGLMAYVHRSNQEAAQTIQKYVLGDGDLSQFTNPLNQIEYKIMSAVNIIPLIFMNPTNFAERLGWKKTMVLRVVGAFVWYQVMRMYYPQDKETRLSEDTLMRLVLASLVRDTQYMASGLVKNKLRVVVGSEVLEELENASFGLIKPDLVDLAFDVVVPFLLTRNSALKNIAAFEPHDFLRYEWWFFKKIKDYHNKSSDDVKQKIANGNYGTEYLTFFIKYRVLIYLLSNFGNVAGRKVAGVFGGKIAQMVYAAFKGSVNFIDRVFINGDEDDDETMPTQFDNIEAAIKEGLLLLKIVLITVLQEESAERATMVGFLKSTQWIDEAVTDPLLVNDSIVERVISFLEEHRVFSHSQTKELLEVYVEQRTQVGPFIDLLIDRIKGNLTATAFGAAGSGLGMVAANIIAWKIMAPPCVV